MQIAISLTSMIARAISTRASAVTSCLPRPLRAALPAPLGGRTPAGLPPASSRGRHLAILHAKSSGVTPFTPL
jgi:hypothetical protein